MEFGEYDAKTWRRLPLAILTSRLSMMDVAVNGCGVGGGCPQTQDDCYSDVIQLVRVDRPLRTKQLLLDRGLL